MKIVFPDYNNCLTNLSNSILKHFGLETYHETLKNVDKLLDNDYENIIVLLYDGMGSKVIEQVLDKNSFLRVNKLTDITSVFPSTTTAATTSIRSGLNPVEHGFLGWDLYFCDLDKTIALFRNTIKDSEEVFEEFNVADKKLNYKSLVDRINAETEANAYGLFPFGLGSYETRDKLYNQIENLTKIKGKKFIYAYVEEPDHGLHRQGIKSEGVNELIKDINDEVKLLAEKLENTLLIVTADHGHIESSHVVLKDYPDLYNLLERTTSIESRAVSFKIKDNRLEEFEKLFNKYFGNDFKLYPKKEIVEMKIFGEGQENKYFDSAIGDYIAIAVGNKYINYDENGKIFKSHHAGLTENEMLVPLIAISKKEKLEDAVIRLAQLKDYDKMRILANEFQKTYAHKRRDIFVSGVTYTQTDFFELCNKKNDSLLFVYEFNNEILGFVETKIINTSGVRFHNYEAILSIERLIVKEEFRSQGIGTKLYQEVYKFAKKRKIDRIEAKVYNFSSEAIKFMESIDMKVLSYNYEKKL